MSVTRRRLSLFGVAALLLTGIIAFALAGGWTSGGQAQAAPAKGEVRVDLMVGLIGDATPKAVVDAVSGSGGEFRVDSFFDVFFVSPIGSSGEDGVRVSAFTVDSFFDITYEIEASGTTGTFQTEMVSMSLTGSVPSALNPGVALDEIIEALKGKGRVFYGHVTVLK